MSSLAGRLRALEVQVMTAAGKGRADDVAPRLAHDFFEIGASGRTYRRTQVLAAIRKAPRRRFSLAAFRVRKLSLGCALVTYRATTGSAAGASSTYRSTLWIRRNQRWKIIFHQGTEIPA